MTQHKISWLNMPGYQPETWNPIVGCSKVSPGCDNCYAERMANRLTHALGGLGTGKNQDAWIGYSDVITNSRWNGQTALIKSALHKPLTWQTPRIVFVCSMGDIFHESVNPGAFQMVLDRISRCRQHIFILLTKRPENVMPLMNRVGWGLPFPPNVWIGVTAENQEQANIRIPILLSIPAAKRFVSIEPMLGPVELGVIHYADANIDSLNGLYNTYPDGQWTQKTIKKLDWVICGGESGSKARPMHPDWVRSVRDQCASANVPFFFKQWGEWLPGELKEGKTYYLRSDNQEVYTSTNKERQNFGTHPDKYSGSLITTKVGRNAAGNLLDGTEHHNWPTI